MGMERPIDPHWLLLADGHLSEDFSIEDVYFEDHSDSEEAGNLDALVAELSEDERDCIELRVYALLSYREVAECKDWYFGDPPQPNKKKAWRVTSRAIRKLRRSLGAEV